MATGSRAGPPVGPKSLGAPSIEDMLVGPVPSGACCVVCSQIFRNPLLAKGCGHTMCQSCALQEIVERGKCPVDRSPLHRDDLIPNRQLSDILDGLRLRCRYGLVQDSVGRWVPGGECTQIFSLGDVSARHAHEEKCPFSITVCPHPNCGKHMQRRELEEHCSSCRYRAVVCPTCGGNVPLYRVESEKQGMVENLQKENEDLREEVLCLRRRLIRQLLLFNPADYMRLVTWILFKNHRFKDYTSAYGLQGKREVELQVLTGTSFAVWLFLYLPSVWFAVILLPSTAESTVDIRWSFESLSTWTVYLPLIALSASGTGPLTHQVAGRLTVGEICLFISLLGFVMIGCNDSAIVAFAYAVAFVTTAITAWATSSTLLQYVRLMIDNEKLSKKS